MESLVSLKCEAALPSGDPLNKDKDGESVTSSSAPAPHRPVKKQTRQWAAWTRQEEESFFNALRQVGKNFEMITCRVQSKNKDQVRHYYYRLVRRMNKLLGPDFSLDAKNSKDTNAAMLRWWSLLEKYRCRASKLHLKPRRFKIFIEALEHQLLKDRKKNIRKRPPQNENCSSSSTATLASQSKSSGHDTRSVKLILVDSQNIQKVAPGKGSLLKRSVNNGTNSSNNKGDLSTAKTRQRRKTGATSSAAYKRWEKAAIAGVSLVADAAEHLERTTIDKNVVPDQGTLDESIPSTSVPTKPADGNSVIDTLGKISAELTLSTTSQQVAETSVQPSLKLKLQLFPIDEATRTALEKEEHNPHLELTLRDRKKITSVLEHLNRKWGKSSIASGELILVPYSAQRDKISGCQKWTQEAVASAADVYASIGSPQVFRLRYGWFSSAELVSITSGSPLVRRYPQEEGMGLDNWNKKGHNLDLPAAVPVKPSSHDSEHLLESFRDQPTSMIQDPDLLPSFTDFPEAMTGYGGAGPENNILKSTESSANSWLRKQSGDGIIRRHWEYMDNIKTSGAPLSAGDWADSLTNISIGELLTEAAQMDTDGSETPVNGSAHNSTHFIQQIPFSCDSFDAAIAAHIAGHQDRSDLPSAQVSHGPSIWDAEETCDAFSFRKIALPKQEDAPSSRTTTLETGKQIASTTSMCFRDFVEELPETRTTQNIFCGEVSTANNCVSNAYKPDSSKDFSGLTDTYWPDSLGPLDLDVPSSKYQGQDLILGDSISLTGLNRLIANSLDAFQNCSFFGLDKVTPAADGRESAPLLERKIGGEV